MRTGKYVSEDLGSVRDYLERKWDNFSEELNNYMESWTDKENKSISKLRDLKLRTVGNRMVLTSNLVSSAGGALTFTHNMKTWQEALAWLGVATGFSISSLCGFGEKTSFEYQKTKELIDNHGRLGELYPKKIFEHDSKLFGYCANQGVYLAAREEGELEEYERMKEKYSDNWIPNF